MKYLADVHAFQEKFGVPQPVVPQSLEALKESGVLEFRLNFIKEELRELEEAIETGDMEGVLDALVDGVYVHLGTALMFGLDFHVAWDRVHTVNMNKVRAQPDGSDSRRFSAFDVVKPEGWAPANLAPLVAPDWIRRLP